MDQTTEFSQTEDSPMLRASDLTHQVTLETDTLTILQGVNLEINRGESVALSVAQAPARPHCWDCLPALIRQATAPWSWTVP